MDAVRAALIVAGDDTLDAVVRLAKDLVEHESSSDEARGFGVQVVVLVNAVRVLAAEVARLQIAQSMVPLAPGSRLVN